MRCSSLGSAALLVGLGLAPRLGALSQGHAGIAGQLLDRTNGAPIAGALVTVLGSAAPIRSDTAGRFAREGLAPGTYVLQVRSLGYTPASRIVDLSDRQTLVIRLELEPVAVGLGGVVVEGERYYQRGMRGFTDRQQRGRGIYVTERDIKEKGARQLGDLLRNVAGVRQSCRRGFCRVRMARDECPPSFFMDGFPANNSTTLELPVEGIIGIEIYRTATETPPEFLRGGATCGVIAIWTRTGP